MNIYEKLIKVQNELKAPKGQFNKFGGYSYRSCEDILEAVKPILLDNKLTLYISDTVEIVQDRYYTVAECTLIDIESTEKITTKAYAREAENKKGMDESQITGSTSSYARKYALNGLFLIDDTKDADAMDNRGADKPKTATTNLTDAQIKRLYAIASTKGFTTEMVKKAVAGYGKASTKELTKAEYDQLINRIENAHA